MTYVDEYYVRDFLARRSGLTGVTFRAEEAEDESVDAQVSVLRDGTALPFHVQVGGGYVALNQIIYDGDGSFYALRQHGMWGVQEQDLLALSAQLDYLVPEYEQAALAHQPG